MEYVDSEESMICALLRRRLMSASSLSSIPSKSANARTTSDVAAGLLRASFPEGLRRVAQIHRPRRVSCAAPGTPLRAVSTVSGLPRGAGPAPSRCLYLMVYETWQSKSRMPDADRSICARRPGGPESAAIVLDRISSAMSTVVSTKRLTSTRTLDIPSKTTDDAVFLTEGRGLAHARPRRVSDSLAHGRSNMVVC